MFPALLCLALRHACLSRGWRTVLEAAIDLFHAMLHCCG